MLRALVRLPRAADGRSRDAIRALFDVTDNGDRPSEMLGLTAWDVLLRYLLYSPSRLNFVAGLVRDHRSWFFAWQTTAGPVDQLRGGTGV